MVRCCCTGKQKYNKFKNTDSCNSDGILPTPLIISSMASFSSRIPRHTWQHLPPPPPPFFSLIAAIQLTIDQRIDPSAHPSLGWAHPPNLCIVSLSTPPFSHLNSKSQSCQALFLLPPRCHFHVNLHTLCFNDPWSLEGSLHKLIDWRWARVGTLNSYV